MNPEYIRNFSIIAHIDHGKSTLADRLLELTGALSEREMEAQTLANTYLAIGENLELVPVINKIDLPGAEPDKVKEQIEHVIGLPTDNAVLASAKTGAGVPDILEAIVRDIPPPKGDPDAPLKALIFDSWYDSYRGVIVLFRVIDGTIKPGMKIRFFNTGRDYQVETLGVNRPRPTPIDKLSLGEVGFLTASIKTVADVQIGDTITEAARPTN